MPISRLTVGDEGILEMSRGNLSLLVWRDDLRFGHEEMVKVEV